MFGGGDGDGDGGGKVLCTYFHRKGEMSQEDYYIGFVYGMKHAHPATLRGYHFWAVPYARYLYNNPGGIMEKIMRPIVLHRAEEISYQMGVRDKPNYKGKLIRAIMEPICYAIGHFVKDVDYKSLYSWQEQYVFKLNYRNYETRQIALAKYQMGYPVAKITA